MPPVAPELLIPLEPFVFELPLPVVLPAPLLPLAVAGGVLPLPRVPSLTSFPHAAIPSAAATVAANNSFDAISSPGGQW
jgi:hypothetical protein